VSTGGHPVPEDKIISRYHRSLELLMDAVKVSNRAYIFDNSGCEQIWLAEITDGHMLEMKTDNIPGWFKTSILDKLNRI
jgi:predicted ABC-type ATPase